MADLPSGSTAMSHLSIGEVLALLLEEFSDITISKIRFLESQGLIAPERTPSGYRKFYDDDVELLRCILREQRENYLPLRVIKDRLDSGEIDPTSETPRPRGIKNLTFDDDPDAGPETTDTSTHPSARPANGADQAGRDRTQSAGAGALFALTPTGPDAVAATDAVASDGADDAAHPPATLGVVPSTTRVLLTRDELCARAALDADQLESLESYGVVTDIKGSGGMYGEEALAIAVVAKRFLEFGFDARHLRGWKVAADREAGLFEQMIQPLLRQRNPQARDQARQQLGEMAELGGELRSALMRSTMRLHSPD